MFWIICIVIFFIILGINSPKMQELDKKKEDPFKKGLSNHELRRNVRKLIKSNKLIKARVLCESKILSAEDFDLLITFAEILEDSQAQSMLKELKVKSFPNISNNTSKPITRPIVKRDKPVIADISRLKKVESSFSDNSLKSNKILKIEHITLNSVDEDKSSPRNVINEKIKTSNPQVESLRERLNKLKLLNQSNIEVVFEDKIIEIDLDNVVKNESHLGFKSIIILANSVKHKQHCVAGKDIMTGQWIRPVADMSGGALSWAQIKIQNPHGVFDVKPLQKVEMGFLKHAPLMNQPENYLIDGNIWRQNYRLNPNELSKYLDYPSDIWGTGDRVDYTKIDSGEIGITQSLLLLSVNNFYLFINQYGKRRASFIYNDYSYEFAVTDPNFDNLLSNHLEPSGIICVSLGSIFNDNCYKLVATIF